MITETFFDEYKFCIDYIRKELKEVHPYCEAKSTIEASNRLFYYALNNAKKRAFAKINSMNKPYVIYQVNKYYSF